jgi:hypothetical protein
MAAIITEKFRVHNARQFKEDFGEANSSTYVFIGRPYDWADENNPPAPANGPGEEIQAWEDMLALKKVDPADVSHGIKRYNWTSGTQYDEYSHDYSASNLSPATSSNNLYDARFYVLTDEYHVYKCIRTGRDENGAVVNSVNKPTGTDVSVLFEGTASDEGGTNGMPYLWKYMYTVSASDTIKFVTNDFIPVKTLGAQTEIYGTHTNGGLNSSADNDGSSQWQVETNAVDGSVLHVKVDNPGSGYTDGTYSNVAIDGDGSSGVCQVIVVSGGLREINVTTRGTGYKNASIDVANISGIGSGSGGVATPVISPQFGHGADPVEELGGNYIIVNSRLEFNEGGGDFPVDNDFRRIGLCQDPFAYGTTNRSTDTTMKAYSQMSLSAIGSLKVDDTIFNASADGAGVAAGRVVSITGTTVSYLPIANNEGGYVSFANADTVYKIGVGSIGTINASITPPEVAKHTGRMMYIENRGAVTRASDQIEDIKLIIEM